MEVGQRRRTCAVAVLVGNRHEMSQVQEGETCGYPFCDPTFATCLLYPQDCCRTVLLSSSLLVEAFDSSQLVLPCHQGTPYLFFQPDGFRLP